MKVTITKQDVENACAAYVEIYKSPNVSLVAHRKGHSCVLAQALAREGFRDVDVNYINVSYTSGKSVAMWDLTQQAVILAEEFDDWFETEYEDGRIGNFAGRTITVWEEK